VSLALADSTGDCLTAISLADGTPLGFATVIGSAPRVFFVKGAADAKGCPAAGEGCRSRAFVVHGDHVFTARTSGDFVCASFVSTKGLETAGWLPAVSLQAQPVAAPAGLEAWVGTWHGNVEQNINIRRGTQKDMLSIAGDATFGALDPDRVARGGVNSGEIAADIAAQSDSLAFAMAGDATKPYDQGGDDDCRVRMRRFGDYLLVEDNRMCGGNNVSFTGTYRR